MSTLKFTSLQIFCTKPALNKVITKHVLYNGVIQPANSKIDELRRLIFAKSQYYGNFPIFRRKQSLFELQVLNAKKRYIPAKRNR